MRGNSRTCPEATFVYLGWSTKGEERFRNNLRIFLSIFALTVLCPPCFLLEKREGNLCNYAQ